MLNNSLKWPKTQDKRATERWIKRRTKKQITTERDLLLGWVEVFRSGLKKHSDLLALGDVDWQLNEGLQAQKIARDLDNHILFSTPTRNQPEVKYSVNLVSGLHKFTEQAITTNSI